MIEKITSFALIIMYLIIIYKVSIFAEKFIDLILEKIKENKKKKD